MSAPVDTEQVAPPPKENPQALMLRGRPRPTVRFRRGLIIGMTAAAAAFLITVSWLALEPPSFHRAAVPPNEDTLAANGAAEALANVPGDYGKVPRLGPPLPGDLGRPILARERSLSGAEPIAPDSALDEQQEGRTALDEERQRIAAARAAARSSPLLVQIEGGHGMYAGSSSQGVVAADTSSGSATAAPTGPPATDLARTRDPDLSRYQPHEAPPLTLSAGTIIPASLITGLNSDLPGIIVAQVTENVRDSATGRSVLIPQGARLIGSYDSRASYGQRRALLVWTRIVFPNGSSVGLDKMPAADAAGYSGLKDRVDAHSWQLIKGIVLSTLLGVGTELSLGNSESDLVRAVRESAQQNAADAGQQLTVRNLDVRPTISVRPGWPVRAIVNEDLVLQPWSGRG